MAIERTQAVSTISVIAQASYDKIYGQEKVRGGWKMEEINAAEFEAKVLKSKLPVVIVIWGVG